MISKKEIQHIATLARIGLADDEADKYTKELSAILDWIEELKKADVSGIESTARATSLENKAREDKVSEFDSRDEIIKQFPEEKNGYDKVKSVL
jgi:aspartyl-tRNA(Asn)/glutamyl-tRNA(Gln) amidotransferase subunit C